jgi:hypothetical protein
MYGQWILDKIGHGLCHHFVAAWIESSKGDGSVDPNIPQMKGARWFSLKELRMCTNNFDVTNEIGEGGYGKVTPICIAHAGSSFLNIISLLFMESFARG